METILSLQSLKEDSIKLVGERVLFLSKVSNIVSIPLGFVVTVEVYNRFMQSGDLNKKIETLMKVIDINDKEQLQNIANEIQKLVLGVHLPKEVAEDVIDAYESLSIGSNLSLNSMVSHFKEPVVYLHPVPLGNIETGAHLSFPNIRSKQKVLDSVVTCYASNFTAKAIENRILQKEEDCGVAVVIQQMLFPSVSGLISTGYVDDEKHIIITACYGFMDDDVLDLGDEYILDAKTFSIVKKNIKTQKIEYRKKQDKDEFIKQNILEERAERQKLPDEFIVTLAKTAKEALDQFNRSLMLEYGIEKGKIYILQADQIFVEPENDAVDDIKGAAAPEKSLKSVKLASEAHKEEQEKLILDDMQEETDDEKIIIDIKDKSDDDIEEIEESESINGDKIISDDEKQTETAGENNSLRGKDKLFIDIGDDEDHYDVTYEDKSADDSKKEDVDNGQEKKEKKSIFSMFKWGKKQDDKVSEPKIEENKEKTEKNVAEEAVAEDDTDDADEEITGDIDEENVEEEFISEDFVEKPKCAENKVDNIPSPVLEKSVAVNIPVPQPKPESVHRDIKEVIKEHEKAAVEEESWQKENLESKETKYTKDTDDATIGTNFALAKKALGQAVVYCDLSITAKLKASYKKHFENSEEKGFDDMIAALKEKADVPYFDELKKISALKNRLIEKGISPDPDEAKFVIECTEKFLKDFKD